MARVHTAHGIGKIIQTETARGRTSHLVEGAGFRAWIPAAQCRTATDVNEGNSTTLPYDPTPQYPADMWSSQTTILPGDQEIDAEERLSPSDSLDFDSRRESIFPEPSPALFATAAGLHRAPEGSEDNDDGDWPGSIYQDHIWDMLDEHGIETDGPHYRKHQDRHGPDHPEAISVDDLIGPPYEDDHLVRDDSLPVEEEDIPPGLRELLGEKLQPGPWTAEDWEAAENFDPTDEYRGHPDSWSHKPTEQDYADWEARHRKNKTAGKVTDFLKGGPGDKDDESGDWFSRHLPGYSSLVDLSSDKHANLDPKYATWMLGAGAGGDDSVSRFARDPQAEIQRLAHLWHGNAHDESIEQYGRLVEADKMLREAAWADVRRKGQRLRREGKLTIKYRSASSINAIVEGDHGVYHTLIKTSSPGQTIDQYTCSCKWGQWAHRRMTYVGRMCSHGYAAYLELKSNAQKGNKGRFRRNPYQRAASITDDFQDYVDEYRDGHVDQDAATQFMDLHEVDADQADTLYDYVEDNHAERAERTFDSPPGCPEGLLRTSPATLTPSLFRVPAPGDPYTVDVEDDERKTTAPDNIMSKKDWKTATHVDDQAQPATGAATEAAPAEDGSVDTTAPAAPPAPATPEDQGNWRGNGFDPSMVTSIVGPIAQGAGSIADSLTGTSLASGIGGAVGSMVSGIGSGLGGFFASRTAADLDDLREITDEDPPLGDMDSYNDQVRDIIDELRDYGADAFSLVAHRRTSSDDDELLTPSGHDSINGSGPRDRDWYTTSEDAIELFDVDGSHTDEEVDGPGTPTNPRSGRIAWKDGDPDDPRTEAGLPPRSKSEGDRNFAENLGGPDPEKARKMVVMDTEEEEPLQRAASAGDHSDIVRRFHASGAAEAIKGGTADRADDDIASRARGFLAKTAGRVYSLAEQQELIDEPGTARNRPTQDDLRGTHYVGD
jgi:hypothetical protein